MKLHDLITELQGMHSSWSNLDVVVSMQFPSDDPYKPTFHVRGIRLNDHGEAEILITQARRVPILS